MEDLLECSVCMDRFALDGDKIPRVFVCEHTFCHSCIKNLVKRGNSITCPTCRRKHKCSNVEHLPRNLTVLQLLEAGYGESLPEPRRNHRRCGECLENKVFCEKCNTVTDENKCRSCLKKKLWTQVSELQKLLAKGKESCEQIPELINHHLTKNISEITERASSEYEHWNKVNKLGNALLKTVNKNQEQGTAFRHDAVVRFHTFHKKATQKLKQIRINLKKNMMTCSTGGVLTTLSNECSMHLHTLKETRDLMLQSQRNTMDISDRLSEHQEKNDLCGNETQPFDRKLKNVEGHVREWTSEKLSAFSALTIFMTKLLLTWIIIGFLAYWACLMEERQINKYYIFAVIFTVAAFTLNTIEEEEAMRKKKVMRYVALQAPGFIPHRKRLNFRRRYARYIT